MSYTPPTVNYYDSVTSSWDTIPGVQSVLISRGRQRFQDPFRQTSLTVTIIPTATTSFSVGQLIDVRDTNADTANCYFQGQITDVQRSYAFPFNSVSGATPEDRITISAAGATGVAGTAQLFNESWGVSPVSTVIETLLTNQGLDVGTTATNIIQASAQTFSGSLLDAVNQLLRTAQLSIDDFLIARSVNKLGFTYYPTGQQFNSIAFTDTGANYAYTGLEYLSSVQNTFNYVEVQATGVFTSIFFPGVPPFNALTYTTFNKDVPDTSNLAAYLFALLSGQTDPVPFQISTDTKAAPTCMVLAQIPSGALANAVIGQPVTVAFRGTSGLGTVIGVNSAFYPDYASVQLYVSPSLGTPFTLDSASFGVLDTNKLGF
jgi:hypothetical protein